MNQRSVAENAPANANRNENAKELSPLAGALSISSSMFVACTSIFVAILAFVAGVHQTDTIGLAGHARQPSSSAAWWCYAIGVAVLFDGFVAGSRARSNPRVAIVTSAVFVGLTTAAWALFVHVW